jgi:cell division cycle protein 20 (cofactor of APC complex)
MYNLRGSQLSGAGSGHIGDHDIPQQHQGSDPNNNNFSQHVQRSLLGSHNASNERILSRSIKAPIAPPQESKIELRAANRHQTEVRHFKPRSREHLRAPYLSTDYSHSALSWSIGNRLAVGLGEQLYIFEVETNRPDQLDTPLKSGEVAEPISALEFSPDGSHIAVGRQTRVEIYDVGSGKCLRRIKAHSQTICDISWYNGLTFALASDDGTVSIHNLSQKQSLLSTFVGHTDSVLSCKWSLDASPFYLATGSLDNTVRIWDLRRFEQGKNMDSVTKSSICYTDATAATKAISWCPFVDKHLLAVGAGTGDGKIRFYDVTTDFAKLSSGISSSQLGPIDTIDTGSQITSINFAVDDKELVTTHGFKNPREVVAETANSVCTWRYPALVRTSCTNHFTDRILFGTPSPLGAHMAFGEATDNLSIAQQGSVYLYQMWETFEEKQARLASTSSGKAGMNKLASKMR